MGGRGVALRAAGGWLDKEIEMEESTQKKNIHPLQGTTKEQKKNTTPLRTTNPFYIITWFHFRERQTDSDFGDDIKKKTVTIRMVEHNQLKLLPPNIKINRFNRIQGG